METVLAKIAKVARERPKEKFTSLAHYINGPALYAAHLGQDGMKAVGVDGVTKAEYEKNIHANVTDLVARLKRHAYKPQPVRRAYIRKEGTNKLRPLGIPAYEDKLVQAVLAEILSTIYEETFLDYSYGFRKGRSCLQALKALNHIIEQKKVYYIVDLWFYKHVREESTGACYLIRYADDFVCCFEKKEDAERFYEQLIERLAKFKLSIAVEKTKIIRFGRPNGDDENPGTFDFLGFTHFCGKSKRGSFRVKRKTARKKLCKSLLSVKQWLVKNMHTPTKELISTLRSK
ncbi:MAG: reverse transcriptase domain-containing protein, partial [Bacillota bacterium]|nr:reverse transcriptase domain-containing protein [Bacillota bacterium]